ncbi:DUF3114 domain-containing protein [Furfurilactobacillus siliginis]|uniref:DUF3114 domain-containing protein n=1 Tax=Furfurilactobacillus siliginis TaxID=348151 RepID=A0A0R2L7R3_9LACO|nr:DUF3114 domain-containing protein [Furfurilactobacillus siliginis]KRN94893.1 hypothetical protein IV55_GL000436 [Furfurilactobacillus siliginis]GEK28468.1 hypothetical protein LSI01_07790 [Furfurilactobacillus siliginis]
MSNHQTLISLIQPPVSLGDANMDKYVTNTYDLLVKLGDHEHWDDGALSAVAHLVANSVNDQNLTTQFNEWRITCNIAGSPIFNTLFQASTSAPQTKLDQLLSALGGHLTQQTGDLAIDRPFAKTLSPNDSFWSQLAQTVQVAFPDGFALDDATTRMVHQLRYHIDAHNVAFVRDNFKQPGQNDLDALLAFDRDALAHGKAASAASSSRMHNKQPEALARGVLPTLPTGNFKRLVNFHSEFIVASVPVPTFITIPLAQIANVNDVPAYVRALTLEERNALVNGASFNYADTNDYRQPNSIHQRLDIHYGQNDPLVRRLAMKPYTSPKSEPRVIQILQQQYDAAVKNSDR